MKQPKGVLLLFALVALSIGAACLGPMIGCAGGLNTPQGVQVNILRVLDQYDNSIDPRMVNTEFIPTSYRMLVASSQPDYGLVATAASDTDVLTHGTFSPNPTPGQTVYLGGYGYTCLYGGPYVLWVQSDLLGSASFTKDGERNQYWIGVTESAAMMLVSAIPSGETVGAPRKLKFSADATIYLYLVIVGPNQYVVVGTTVYEFVGGLTFINIPPGGLPLVDLQSGIVCGTFYWFGVTFSNPGLSQVATLIPAGVTQIRVMYVDVSGLRIFVKVPVLGTGPGGGGGGGNGTLVIYPEEVKSR